VPYTKVSRVTISSWGSHGLYVDTPIVTEFDSVVSMLNGGDGFHGALLNVTSVSGNVLPSSGWTVLA
jgi:hypothetical protein